MSLKERMMEVVYMLCECENYYNEQWSKARAEGNDIMALTMLGQVLAYSNARQMLMKALTKEGEN